VWLKAVGSPDALDGTGADTDSFRHHARGPVGRLGWRVGLGQSHDTLNSIAVHGWDTRRPCLVTQQAVVPFLHEAFLPAPNTGLRLAGSTHDLVGADAVHAQQDDLGSPHVLVRRVAILCQGLEPALASRLERKRNSTSHAQDSHADWLKGIPFGIQMSDAIH
jgi:hypothetical protein